MNDAEILEWIESHLTELHMVGKNGSDVLQMSYMDYKGDEFMVEGATLRDCVAGAIQGEGATKLTDVEKV